MDCEKLLKSVSQKLLNQL